MADVFGYTKQLPEEHVRMVLGNQCIDFFCGLAVVKVSALHGQTFEKRPCKTQQDLQFRDPDEVDGLAIRLQGSKGVLLVDFRVVVEGTEYDLVVLRELLYLVESP